MNVISSIVPEHALTWEGFPLFHVADFPADFSGKLFFVLGQGLGDHINGFRVLHEIRRRFPKARLIVYADLRWEELVRRIEGIEIRWFPKALEVRSKEGTNDPYIVAHSEIRMDMDAAPGASFLAYAHFPMPDRHARGESTIQATMRSIGLSLGANFRPFLPVLESDLLWADHFLEKNGFQSGHYAVIAPFTWPNKRWPKEQFSEVIDLIRESLGLRSLIIAYPEMGEFKNEGAFCAYDLSLGQISGLLSRSGIYLGLDSGLSHMAAALELPSVEIFIEKKVIPFEVRACSQLFLYNIEGFFLEQSISTTESVFSSLSFLWKNRNNLSTAIPLCPACLCKAQYIAHGSEDVMDFMCVCGTTLSIPMRDHESAESSSEVALENDRALATRKTTRLRIGTESDLSLRSNLMMWEKRLEASPAIETVEVSFEIAQDSECRRSSQTTSSTIKWSMDGVFFWMGRMGYHPVSLKESQLGKRRNHLESLCFVPATSVLKQDSQKFAIPWGSVSLNVRSIDQYLKWYSFEKWGKPPDLVGIVKSMSSLGYGRDALESAWVSFRANPVFRSFRWLLKACWSFYSKPS